jgi:hypothetical protein
MMINSSYAVVAPPFGSSYLIVQNQSNFCVTRNRAKLELGQVQDSHESMAQEYRGNYQEYLGVTK